jgi:hypothetical protein
MRKLFKKNAFVPERLVTTTFDIWRQRSGILEQATEEQ